MKTKHSPECEQYLLAGEQIPAIAAMAAEFRKMTDAEIWTVYYDLLDEDHGTDVEPFLLGLFHLLTPEVKHLHYVTITGDEDNPRIEFTCRGDRNSECHSYPDCECESWKRGDHEHPFVAHDECWMKPWFGNDCTSPYADSFLVNDGIRVGMSGPITASLCGDYVEWAFITPEAK